MNKWRKGAAFIAATLLIPAMAAAAPTTIIDNTPISATNDGTIGGGEYIGSSVGINTGFGDVIGAGSLLHVDSANDGTLNFGLQTGGGSLNDIVVIYIDAGPGGFADTGSFVDILDPHRRAISGFDGTNRSTLTFAAGFAADFAIAFDATFAGVWALTAGSHTFTLSAPLTGGATQWELQLNMSDIGLSAGSSFDYVATYLNASNAFRSDEFQGVAGTTVPAGNIGQAPVSLAAGDFNTFQSTEAPVATENAAWSRIKVLFQ